MLYCHNDARLWKLPATVTVTVTVSHRVTVTPPVDVPSHATRQRESRVVAHKLPEIIGFFCFLVIPRASRRIFHVIFAVLFGYVSLTFRLIP